MVRSGLLSARANGACWCRCAAILVFSLAVGVAHAVDLPALTGRVVDQANVIPAANRSAIEGKLKQLEDKSGIQLVVATVTSLQGNDIETFANQLFRHWKLGEANKNNGVLLLVAPKERKVRIEVGYGLEGTLTDALSNVIITGAIVPRFKTNDYAGGIERGVDGIISVLTTDAAEWQPRARLRTDDGPTVVQQVVPLLLLLGLLIFIFRYMVGHARGGQGGWVGRGGRPMFIPVGGAPRRGGLVRAGRGGGAPGSVAAGDRCSSRLAARPGAAARPGRTGVAAASPAAGLRAGADRPAEAERREAGDADYQGRSCGDRRRDPFRRAADVRPDRLRADALVLGIFLRARAVGGACGVAIAMAADRADAVERAANLRGPDRGFCRGRAGAVLAAIAHGSGAACGPPSARASRGDRAVLCPRSHAYKTSNWRADLRIARGALCPDRRR